MSDDDDGDVPSMGPETTGGQDETGEALSSRTFEPSGDDPVVRTRSFSDKTRELFKAGAAKLKEQLGEGGADELVLTVEPEGKDAPTEGAQPLPGDGGVGTAEASPTVAATPPPAQVSAEVEAERAALAADRAALIAERADWERQRAAPSDEAPDDPAAAVKDLLRRWTGAADDTALRGEVADLISELSASVLGIALHPETRQQIAAKKAERIVARHNSNLSKREQALEAKAAEQQQVAERARIVTTVLAPAITKAADKFPFLAAEDNAADIIYEMAAAEYKRTKVDPNWETLAAKAEEHIKAKATAWAAKRSKLFQPTAMSAAATQHSLVTQGGAPSSQGAKTLSNRGGASPAIPSPADDGEMTNEMRRARSKARLREVIATAKATGG